MRSASSLGSYTVAGAAVAVGAGAASFGLSHAEGASTSTAVHQLREELRFMA